MKAFAAIERLAQGIILGEGWRRACIAFSAGAIGAAVMAPLHLLPALALSLPVAVWLIDGAQSGSRRTSLIAAAVNGWWFGFGFFLAGLWWLGSAFLVDGDLYLWALPLGVLGLPAGLALFHALAFAAARLIWSAGPWRIFALAFGLGLADWLRGFLLTGFPWNTFGQAAAGWLWLMQATAFVGTETLGLFLVAVFASPALLVGPRPKLAWPAFAAVLLVLLFAAGGLRLARAPESEPVTGVMIRIVQPNVPQGEKNQPRSGAAVMKHHLDLSDRPSGVAPRGLADVTHVIWPESVFPFILAREPQALSEIARALPRGVTLITGAARMEDGEAGRPRRFFNALQVVDDGGAILQSYDKVHLVPFGEYLPGRSILERYGVHQFVRVPGGFSPGVARQTLDIPGLPAAVPLICYEVIFPAEFRSLSQDAGLIINLTNDAWFGATFGPAQHFAQARLRAVELGLPLVRAANTGISGVVDPYGRVIARLELDVEGTLDSPLPRRIPPTIYTLFGGSVFLGALALSLVLAIFGIRRGR